MNSLSKGRMHALDNLRACMMWLGIVLHVAINHLVAPSFIPFKDRDLSVLADMTVVFIHSFRMPVFFVLAGLLAAMMADTRGYRAMLRNRLRRIALPFAVFWPLVFVASIVLVLMFRHMMATGTFGLSLADAPKTDPSRPALNTMHMWFIYYLLWFCLLAGALCALEKFIPEAVKSCSRSLLEVLARQWWGFVLLAIPMALVASGYRAGMLQPTGSFIPNIKELVHNGMFFVFGWTVYRLRDDLLAQYARQCWKFVAGGLVFYTAAGALFQVFLKAPASIPHIEMVTAYVYGSASWLWSIALIGLFVRYLPPRTGCCATCPTVPTGYSWCTCCARWASASCCTTRRSARWARWPSTSWRPRPPACSATTCSCAIPGSGCCSMASGTRAQPWRRWRPLELAHLDGLADPHRERAGGRLPLEHRRRELGRQQSFDVAIREDLVVVTQRFRAVGAFDDLDRADHAGVIHAHDQ